MNKKKYTGSMAPALLDFSSLPVMEVALVLRRLGGVLLNGVLGGGGPPGATELISPEEALLFLDARKGWADWRIRWSQHLPLPRDLLIKPLGRLALNAARRPDTPANWKRRVLDWVAMDVGGPSLYSFPKSLWRLAGEIAWRDLEFQRRTAAKIGTYLRKRTPLPNGRNPIPRLSPGTFWLLIALAEPARPAFPGRFGARARRSRNALILIRRETWGEILRKGWAGFWDQWIISSILSCGPHIFDRLPPDVLDSLLAMPLLEQAEETPPDGKEGIERKTAEATKGLASPRWKQEQPEWFEGMT